MACACLAIASLTAGKRVRARCFNFINSALVRGKSSSPIKALSAMAVIISSRKSSGDIMFLSVNAYWLKLGRLFSSCFICSFNSKRIKRQTPLRRFTAASRSVSKSFTDTLSISSSNAGYPTTFKPSRSKLKVCGKSPKSHCFKPVFSISGEVFLNVSCAADPNCFLSAFQSRPMASSRPASSTTLKFISKCAGVSSVQSSIEIFNVVTR